MKFGLFQTSSGCAHLAVKQEQYRCVWPIPGSHAQQRQITFYRFKLGA